MEYYRRILIAYEQEVLASIPNPFGSFEKATYILKPYSVHNGRYYKFITTAHNTEDAIQIMKNVFKQKYSYRNKKSTTCAVRYYRIIKKVKGKEELVYESQRYIA